VYQLMSPPSDQAPALGLKAPLQGEPTVHGLVYV